VKKRATYYVTPSYAGRGNPLKTLASVAGYQADRAIILTNDRGDVYERGMWAEEQ
jgi:hypothetical protein